MEVREPLRRSFDAVWPPAGTGSRSRPADTHQSAGPVLSECCADVTRSYHFREVREDHGRAGARPFTAGSPEAGPEPRHFPVLARKDSRS